MYIHTCDDYRKDLEVAVLNLLEDTNNALRKDTSLVQCILPDALHRLIKQVYSIYKLL